MKNELIEVRILYATTNGIILAKAAKEWFSKTYAEEIATVGYIKANITRPIKEWLKYLPSEKEINGKVNKKSPDKQNGKNSYS